MKRDLRVEALELLCGGPRALGLEPGRIPPATAKALVATGHAVYKRDRGSWATAYPALTLVITPAGRALLEQSKGTK